MHALRLLQGAVVVLSMPLCALAENGPSPEPSASVQHPPARIVVGLPVAKPTSSGELTVVPNVAIRPGGSDGTSGGSGGRQSFSAASVTPLGDLPPVPPPISFAAVSDQALMPVADPLPAPPAEFSPNAVGPPIGMPSMIPMAPGAIPPPIADPMFGDLIEGSPAGSVMIAPMEGQPCRTCGYGKDCKRCDPCHEPWHRLFDFGIHRTTCGDPGIGQERVMLAPFFIDITQPFNNTRVEYISVDDFHTPDRALYLWANSGAGGPPLPDQRVDYQDLRFVNEVAVGNDFSITTGLPLRSIDPENNLNTTGLGDMDVTTKIRLLDGRYWQFTQIFRTHINTGSVRKGLGNGHVTLEPGILARYEWNPRLYFHGQFSVWVPVGADPAWTGPALKYGIGASYVAYETDTFAVLPTLELNAWNFLDGLKTGPYGIIETVDGENSFMLQPGTRFVLGPEGDLGLFELGVAGGIGITNNRLYDSIMQLQFRWSY